MIINFLIGTVVLIINAVVSIIPSVTLASIPFAGSYIQTYLTMAVQYWNGILQIVPYLQLPWHMFLWVIIPFEVMLLTAKFFFGSRLPANVN